MKYLSILIGVAICLAVGFVASMMQSEALQVWYPVLYKPSVTPPDSVFPIAWTILYVLMGISAGLVWNRKGHPARKSVLLLFAVQLALNFSWSIAFFYFRDPCWGLIVITLLLLMLIVYAVKAYPVNRLSSMLFIPYILWVAFAWYLNFYIFMNN